MPTPADEEFDVEPDPRLEKFFHIVMLVMGDPDTHMWIERFAVQFYREYEAWIKTSTSIEGPVMDRYPTKATAILQYIVWYDREKSHIDGRRE